MSVSCSVLTNSLTLTNWFGKQDLLLVVEYCPQFDRAGRRVDLVVDRIELAVGELGRAGAVIGGDRQGRAGRTRFITSGKLSSGKVKMTEIGCSWVTTTMPLGSLVWT